MKQPVRTYRVRWSPEDDEFVATCDEYPSISCLDASEITAISGLCSLVISEFGEVAKGPK